MEGRNWRAKSKSNSERGWKEQHGITASSSSVYPPGFYFTVYYCIVGGFRGTKFTQDHSQFYCKNFSQAKFLRQGILETCLSSLLAQFFVRTLPFPPFSILQSAHTCWWHGKQLAGSRQERQWALRIFNWNSLNVHYIVS